MNAIRLEINTGTKESPHWEDAYLPDDVSFSIEETSIVFGDNDVFSQGLELPIEPNLHIFGNSAELHGESVYDALYGKQFRLWVCGVLFKTGVIILDDEIDIDDDSVEIELHSSQRKNLDELLEGVNARDVEIYEGVPKDEKVQIGWCFPPEWNVEFVADIERSIPLVGERGWGYSRTTVQNKIVGSTTYYMPKMMVPYAYEMDDAGGTLLRDFTNTSAPYPQANYCNIRICSQRMVKDSSWEKRRGYHIGRADRANSAPCFYVMYWLELLMKRIGMFVSQNDLYNIPDALRLAFVHTNCEFKAEWIDGASFFPTDSDGMIRLNEQLRCKVSSSMVYEDRSKYIIPIDGDKSFGLPEAKSITLRQGAEYHHSKDEYKNMHPALRSTLYKAYATSDNFPDADAMEIIHAIESMFNVKFVYDENTKSVRVISVADVLRRNDHVPLRCVISDVYKRENHVRGFRLKYKNANQIARNAINHNKVYTGTKDSSEETTYNYYDFRRVVVGKSYDDLIVNIGCYDMNLYVDIVTGNLHRVKVDKDAKEEIKLYPSLMEVMGYHDVEIGECEAEFGEDEFVHEVEVGFSPAIQNDVNFTAEKAAIEDGANDVGQLFATFVDIDIHSVNDDGDPDKLTPETVNWTKSVAIREGYKMDGGFEKDGVNEIVSNGVKVNTAFTIEALDNYDISENHPYDGVDFGLTVGILRDSTSIGGLDIFNNNYDNEGNSEWKFTSESNGDFTSDSVDSRGNPLCTHAALDINAYEDIVSRLNAELGRSLTVQDLFPIMADSVSYWLNQSGISDLDGKVVFGGVYPISHKGVHTLWFFSNRRATSYNDDYISSVILQQDGDGLQGTTPEERLAEMKANDWAGLLAGSYPTKAEAEAAARKINQYAVRNGIQELGLSLKLQAEKYNPDSKDKVNNTYGDYPYPISADCAKRGIYDKFYAEFAHFIINRNIAVITIERGGIELADVLNLDWCQKYTIGDYCGWLGKVTYELDKDGLGQVQIELYYL